MPTPSPQSRKPNGAKSTKATWDEFVGLLSDLGMTQAQFAAQVGINKTTITKWKTAGVPKLVVLYLKQLLK